LGAPEWNSANRSVATRTHARWISISRTPIRAIWVPLRRHALGPHVRVFLNRSVVDRNATDGVQLADLYTSATNLIRGNAVDMSQVSVISVGQK
jgi:hypothetical protein